MEESADLHEEAGKENEQTLANLSLPEEVMHLSIETPTPPPHPGPR